MSAARALRTAAALLAAVVLASCFGARDRGVIILVDASGTYFGELPAAARASSALVTRMRGGDRFTVAEIGSCSFSDEAVKVDIELPSRPSESNLAKSNVIRALERYRESATRTPYTDIHGALLQASAKLENAGASASFVVIFSDLVEDPVDGCNSQEVDLDLKGVTVVAANVIKLREDTSDPANYFARLQSWEDKVTAAGGEWLLVNDTSELVAILQ